MTKRVGINGFGTVGKRLAHPFGRRPVCREIRFEL